MKNRRRPKKKKTTNHGRLPQKNGRKHKKKWKSTSKKPEDDINKTLKTTSKQK